MTGKENENKEPTGVIDASDLIHNPSLGDAVCLSPLTST